MIMVSANANKIEALKASGRAKKLRDIARVLEDDKNLDSDALR